MKSYYFLIALFSISISVSAQKFIRPEKNQKNSFTQMQKQFGEWKKTHDLKNEKHWKYFKRFEAENQKYTNCNGELSDPSIFNAEALEINKMKNASSKTSMSPWFPAGPNYIPDNLTGYMENGIGRINCIAFHPTDTNTFYVGVAQGGLWKTSNSGTSWIPLTDDLPITRISDIAIDPNNPNTIYISLCDFEYIGFGLYENGRKRNTHYGLGVYKSTDGGTTWNPTGLTFQLTNGDASLIREILINPLNSNHLLACGVSGMYKSLDAGTTWNKTLDSLFWDLHMVPGNTNTLYAATGWVQNANDGEAAIFKSTDFGNTWNKLNTGIPPVDSVQRVKLAISKSDPNYIYAVTVNTDEGLYGIYKSTDAGQNWIFIHPGQNILDAMYGGGIDGQGTYDLGFWVDNLDKNKLYCGGVNLYTSTDGAISFNPAASWTLYFGETIHGDYHYIEQQPISNKIFITTDGGVYSTHQIDGISWSDIVNNSIPWSTNWTKMNDGMQISSFYRLSSSQNMSGKLLAGAQDNATMYFNGANWSTISGGDGMDNIISPFDDMFMICSSQYGNFAYTADEGQSFTDLSTNNLGEDAEWTTPIIPDYNINETYYIGNQNVMKTVNSGMSWTQISFFPSNSTEISALAVANSNSDVLYVVKRVRFELGIPGNIYKTTNGGTTWNSINSGLPDSLYCTSIEVHPTNENIAYVTFAQFSNGNKVFQTLDGGSTWQNISYNLPNIPMNCIKVIPGTSDLMLASDIGLWVLPSGSNAWQLKSDGLPNVIISDIEFNVAMNKVYISTFGRGLWGADLSSFTQNTQSQSEPIFNLFPTQNNGTFTLQILNSNSTKTFDYQILDINGKQVYSSTLKTTQTINLPLVSGMYFLKMEGRVKKFVVD